MIREQLLRLFKKLRLVQYKLIFTRVKEKSGSLSATEAFAVDVIYLLGTPSIKQFSEYLGISQPNATYKVNNLITKGYIKKVPSPHDKREFLLEVTDKFFGYFGTQHNYLDKAVGALRSRYSEAELDKFGEMLSVLSASMG